MRTSESVTEIQKALAAFQAEVPNPPRNKDNPFYNSKYADLAMVIDTAKPVLAKNDLAVIQDAGISASGVFVTTRIMHSSGEWIESEPISLPPEKLTPQGMGSVITYLRRYQLSAMLGIASEDDDDGNIMETSETPEKSPQKARRIFVDVATSGRGASEKSVNFAKRLFVEAGICERGAKDETDEEKEERRKRNRVAVKDFLEERGIEADGNNPLESLDQATVSQIIDELKAMRRKTEEPGAEKASDRILSEILSLLMQGGILLEDGGDKRIQEMNREALKGWLLTKGVKEDFEAISTATGLKLIGEAKKELYEKRRADEVLE